MKLTKKVLSLILAAALLVGTVAVAANAAEGLTQYAGSEMSYFITSDKDVSDGNAEVKPGETITVTVSMTTNFYPGTSGGETIFWTKGFFESDTPDVAMDDVLGWWKNTTTYPVTSSAAYPSDCPMDTYVMYLNNRSVNTDMTGTDTHVFDNQTMYTITFTVPDDAEVGSTALITLPASKLSTATQTGRNYTMCQSVSGTTNLSSSKAKAYAETVNVDSLTITVVEEKGSEEPPVTVDPIFTYEGSEMSYFVTSDKDVSDGKAEVKPGDTLNVTVSMSTNFHPGTSGGETIFWTKGFFESDTPDVAMDDVLGWWKNTTTYPVTSSAAYPSDCPMDTYVMYLNNRSVNTDMTGTETYAFSNQKMYTITFQIPDDAEVGSTALITLPASKLSTATQTGRNYTMCQSISGTTTLSSSKVKAYAETVNVDSLVIEVVSDGQVEPPVVEIDYAELIAKINEVKGTDTSIYTKETADRFTAALEAAQALVNNAETQDDVTNALTELTNAFNALDELEKVNYEALVAAINEYKTAEADKANYSNWADYEALYNTAAAIDQNVVYDDENGTIQAKVTAAAKALNDFVLVEYNKVNYDALNDAIAAYEEKAANKDIYSNWADYEALYNVANEIDQTVVYDKNGEQKAADDAAAALNNFVLVEYNKVNYDALDAAIAEYESKVDDKNIYANWAEYEALYNTAKALADAKVERDDAEGTVQAAVNAAAKALNDFDLVELAIVNYDALDAAIAEYESKVDDKNIYANWAEYEALYNTAKALADAKVERDDAEGTVQAAVDAAAKALDEFALEEKTLSYDKWNAAVAEIPADLAGFKPASVTAYEAAKAAAEEAKAAAVEALDQTALDAAADALTAAIALLEVKADNSALAEAIIRAQAKADNAAAYTPDSFAAADLANVLAAANVVLANGDATAEEIAEQVAAIEAAEAKLVVKADKGDLADAIAAAQALVENEAAYTPASFAEANLAAEIAAAQKVYDDANATAQAVADAIVALKAAEAKLVLKADKAALENAINTEVVLENATSETLAAYNEALKAAQDVFADENATEDAVLTATNNLLAAIDGLKYLGTCDYDELNAVIAEAEELNPDDYTTTSWYSQAYLDIYLEKAKEVAPDMIADEAGENQAIIDEAARALRTAIDTLELKANLADLKAAIAADPKVAEEYATEDTWAAYAEKLAAAQAIVDEEHAVGVSRQAEVDEAAAALVAANNALTEKPASYAAVDEALALVESKGDLNQYTQATVKALEKAIAAVVYDLGISRQEEIDAWAKAIVDAANALVISEAAVTEVDVDLSDYYERATKDYTFKVTGAPTRLQIVYPNGSTMTYDRYNRYITVVSYNEAGEVVDYAEEAPAYEEWTISIALGEGTYQVKAKIGSAWEAFAYDFTVEFAEAPDPREEEVIFVAKQSGTEAEAGKTLTAELGSVAEVTVIVPDTVVKVMIAYPAYGNEATFTRDNASVVDNGDGTCTWTVARNVPANGKYEMTLSLKDKSGWYAPNTEAIEVLVNYVEEVDNRDAEVTMVAKPVGSDVEAGATLAIAKNTAAEVTVVVPDTVVKLQLCIPTNDGTATYAASNATIVDNGDGTCTWTVIRNFRAIGNYDMTLKLKDSKGWYDANATVIAVECE